MFTVQTLTSILNQSLPEPHAGLLAGLLFGTKTTLSSEFYDALIRSGTLHIIALSGMNIGIVGSMIGKSLRLIVSRRIASLLTIGGILFFVWFVGPSPSIVRAAIMGSISLFAVVSGRQYWPLLSWILAVSVMILLNIQWLFDISFQLSALATLGIILFGSNRGAEVSRQRGILAATSTTTTQQRNGTISSSSISRVFNAPQNAHPHPIIFFLWTLIADNLRLTLAAQVFTIPLILMRFGRISLISPISNLLIGWLIGPLTVLGWITVALGWIWLPFSRLIAWVDWALLSYLLWVVKWTANIPFASLGM